MLARISANEDKEGKVTSALSVSILASFSVIQLLVEVWPDAVHLQDENGYLPLHHACCNTDGQLDEVIPILVECWPQSLLVSNNAGCLPLHLACWNQPPLVIRYLIDTNLQVMQVKDNNLCLPLHDAIERYGALLPMEVIEHLVCAWPKSCLIACPIEDEDDSDYEYYYYFYDDHNYY